jgi:hypothetical protein
VIPICQKLGLVVLRFSIGQTRDARRLPRRPPRDSAAEKGHRLIDECENYIFFSTEPTEDYLTETLKWIEQIQPILAGIEGNGTGTTFRFCVRHQFYSRIARVIHWLQTNRRLSVDEVKAKYPTLIPVAVADNSQESVFTDLLSQQIRRDRLGEVIDDVLGLTGTPDASKHTAQTKPVPRQIKRYSPEL